MAQQIREVVENNRFRFKDRLINLLSRKTVGILHGSGQHRLRQEIRDEINRIIYSGGEGRIRQGLFSEFVIQ